MSQPNEEVGKLFVGGLSWETTQESLCRFFSRFGEVVDCVVMKNNETGRSRGFGFVTFKDPECVQVVLSSGPHNLDGRTIDPKACNPRSMQKPGGGGGGGGEHRQFSRQVSPRVGRNETKNKGNHPKIFLGGLPSNITETDLRNFFSTYGKVIEVVIMYDQEKKRSRGFGFLSYETEDSVEQVCAEHYVTINGKQVECKKAEPRDGRSMGKQGSQWNGAGMGMGPGGMPPPHMGGPMGPPSMGPMANGMPANMLSAGYQPAGWGAPQQGGYGQGYGAPPQSPGYQGWGAPAGFGYPAGPSYGSPPQAYGSFDVGAGSTPSFGGYNWGSPAPAATAGPSPPAPGTGIAASQDLSYPAGPSAGPGNGTSSASSAAGAGAKQDFGYSAAYGTLGSYAQEASSFGPARYGRGVGQDEMQNSGYSQAGGETEEGYGGQGDSPQSGYSGSQGANYSRSGGQTQGYHPYRRQ